MKVIVKKTDILWRVYCPCCAWVMWRDVWFDAMWLANYHAETHKQCD